MMKGQSRNFLWGILPILFLILFIPANVNAQLSSIGGFEGDMPSYWTKGAEPSGSTLEWATDQSRSLGKSLKITKGVTSEAAVWESENMADFWSPQHLKDVDIKVGAWVRTFLVNTDPQTEDEKWKISYTFYDESGSLIGETVMDLDQTTASSGAFYADTNDVAETILPEDSWTTIIKFIGGKDATGTVWTDDFIFLGRGGAWAGEVWNNSVAYPTGWIDWLQPNGGKDGQYTNGFENTIVTTEESHSGSNSLKFDLPFTRDPGDGWVGTKRMMMLGGTGPGDYVRVSVWLKASNLVPDSAALYPETWAVGFTYAFWKGNGNNDGWNTAAGGDPVDMQFVLPSVSSFDWTQFFIDIPVPNDLEAVAMSVRLHPYSRFTGTIYFDDLKVEKIEAPGINVVGGFEGDMPSYWTKGAEPSGSTLEWATDQFHSLGKSLKITKGVTTEAAEWESENMADFWSPQHLKDVDIKLGAWIRTEGVNTNPATEDEKWKVSYSFYDSAGALIGETVMDLDQSTTSSGAFYADTNDVAETILPEDSWTTIIKFIGGKDATGTVWADDFIFLGRGEAWAGEAWNNSVAYPTGWIDWLQPNGGKDGQYTNGFENTIVTTEEARSGTNSLKFDLPFTRDPGDGWVGTKRMMFLNEGLSNTRAVLRISVWLKASNLVPDSAALYPETWAVGFTYAFWKGNGNNDGWNTAAGGDPVDMQFVLPAVTEFDWIGYSIDVPVPDDPEAVAMSVRLHVYSRFTGTIYWDDLEVRPVAVTDVENDGLVPAVFDVSQNYPNPFNPSTVIQYSIPQQSLVTIKVYDILGTEVTTLVNEERTPGIYSVQWNGDNNYGSKVASGIYLYRVVAGNFIQVKKMILLK